MFQGNLQKNDINKMDYIKSNLLFGAYCDADFSICIPIYGVGRYLRDTLRSIKKIKKLDDFIVQIVISNNSGNHNDDEKIIQLIKDVELENVAYFNTDSSIGQMNNFNRSIQLCMTQYVSMLHDDDLLCADFYKYAIKAIQFYNDNPDVGMIHERYGIFFQNEVPKDKNIDEVSFYEITPFMITHGGSPRTGIPSCGIIFNRSTFIKCGGFNSDYPYIGDALLSIYMMQNNLRIIQTNNVTGYYRIATNTSMKTNFCIGLLKEGEAFRDYWQKSSFVRNVYMTIFRRVLYSQDIDLRVDWFGRNNPDINIASIDYKKNYRKYKHNSPIMLLFRIGNKIMFQLSKIRTVKII